MPQPSTTAEAGTALVTIRVRRRVDQLLNHMPAHDAMTKDLAEHALTTRDKTV
jgi:hypothetical protein